MHDEAARTRRRRKPRAASRVVKDRAERKKAPWFVHDVLRWSVTSVIGLATGVSILWLSIDGGLIPLTNDEDVLTGREPAEQQLLVILALAFWAPTSLLMSIATVLTFALPSAQTSREWLIASRPPGRPAYRALWLLGGGGAGPYALTGATVSVIAIIALAITPTNGWTPLFTAPLAIATIIGSWIMMWTSFALRVARQDATEGGLKFAERDTDNDEAAPTERRFTDYLYIAAQLSTGYGTGDTQVVTASMRRLSMSNIVFAFAFNTTIIALLVSVLLGLVQT